MKMDRISKIVDDVLGESIFLKEARKWDDMSLEDQKAYLKRHH